MNKHKQRESQEQNDKDTKEKLSEKEKTDHFVLYIISSIVVFSILSINPFGPNLHFADHRPVLKLLKVLSSHLNWGARLDSFDLLLNTR
jgi:hypothetical protein